MVIESLEPGSDRTYTLSLASCGRMGKVVVTFQVILSSAKWGFCVKFKHGNPLNVLAWRIPGTGKPGGLLSVGSHRVLQD